jgi:hypothetical protein
LGITDETTHLLTPKEIREGSGADTKLITSAEADNKIATEVPTISPQFTVVNGEALFDTIYEPSTSNIISLRRSRKHAGGFTLNKPFRVTRPIYHYLTVSKDEAESNMPSLVFHCSKYVPEILVPFGPRTYFPTYSSESEMVAASAQADQVVNQFYTYDDVVFWRYNGVATNSISDYTEFSLVTGGEPWGTKPEWLTIIGDPYLVGVDNLNVLKFTYYEFEKIDGVLYKDEVICEIISVPNGNMDISKPDLDTLILLDFNQYQIGDPIEEDSVQNLSFYNQLLVPEILRPSTGLTFENLGGGNLALARTLSILSISSRPVLSIPVNLSSGRLFLSREITLIYRIKLFNHSTEPTSTGLFGNQNDTGNFGFGTQRQLVSSQGRPRIRISGGTSARLMNLDGTSQNWQRNATDYYTVGMKYIYYLDGGGVGRRLAKIWIKSSDAGLNLTEILNNDTTQVFPVNAYSGLPVNFESNVSNPSSTRNTSQDYIQIVMAYWDDQKIIDKIFEIDGPNNA